MMRSKWIVTVSSILLAAIGSLFLSCSEDDTTPSGPGGQLLQLQVSPDRGAPGSPLEITGYAVSPGDTTVAIFVGGHVTPFVADSASIVTLIPLFLENGALWPTIPFGPQDVFIVKAGDTVAQALGAVSIDSLPHADGTMAEIAQDLQTISSSLGAVLNSLSQLPGEDERIEGYRLAISFMLDSLVSGADSSLQAILAGSTSWTAQEDSAMALQDAIMASCGALDYYDGFANSVGQFSQKVTAATQSSIFCRGGGPDMDLACEMQIYTILEDYKNYVVKPTSQTYTESVKIGADLIAISGVAALPILVINSIMSVWEFVYGTLAPSLFPAEITAFTLTLDSDTIGIGEPTYSTIAISAKNIPSTIKATQVLDVLIDALAAKGVPQGLVTEFREILKETIKFALDLYRKCLVAYNDSQGGAIFIDPEADLPEMTWGPVTINHSDLIELFSLEPGILEPDTSILEWIGQAEGEGAVHAQGRSSGERAKVLIDHALCAICVYSGGAFGNNVPATESRTVVVGRGATLHVQINGLPGATDGSVFVDGPEGYSSGKITQSRTLTSLKPGNYHVYAFAVRDAQDYEYVPSPVDTTITLNDEDDVTLSIGYKARYGSLLVTVSGLPEGVPADIDLTGDGVFAHIVSDTLIDSLLTGTYTIEARDVQNGPEVTFIASPHTQTVEIIGRQTATASVDYGGQPTIELQTGFWRTYGIQECMWAHAGYEYYYRWDYANRQFGTAADSICGTQVSTDGCDGEGNFTGGGQSGSTVSAGSLGSSSSASITYSGTGNAVTATIGGSASSNYVLTGDTANYYWSGRASSFIEHDQVAMLILKNPTEDTSWFHVNMNAAGSATMGRGIGLEFYLAPYYSCPGGNDGYTALWLYNGSLAADSAEGISYSGELLRTAINPGEVRYYGIHVRFTTGVLSFYEPGFKSNEFASGSFELRFELTRQ